MTATVRFSTCTLCEAMCGIRVEVESGKIASIRGDDDDTFSRGHICPKAHALAELVDDPDRLRSPLKRVNGTFEPIEWDQAFDEIADRLHAIQTRDGRDAAAIYLGNPTVHSLGAMLFAPLFSKALRTKNRFSATSVDQLPHMLVSYLMFGHQLLLPVPDIDRTDLFVVFGANPLASNGSLMTAPDMRRRLRELHQRGGRSIVFDPRRTETAKAATEHVFVRPGTDALVLFALVRTLFELGPRIGDLANACDGIDEVRSLAEPFTPERVASKTGVPAQRIRELARDLLATRRAVVYGRVGTSTQSFGTLCQWLIDVANVLAGHLDSEGGAMFTTPAVDALAAATSLIGRGSYDRYRSRVRGLPEFAGELPVATLAEEIREEGKGRIRALFTSAGNPVLSTPNGRALDTALATLELMVSIDFYVNETTRHAHYVLPPTGPLERSHYDLAFHALAVRNTAKLALPVVEPRAGAKHDWEIFLALRDRILSRRDRSVAKRARRRFETATLRALGPEGLLDLALRAGPHGIRHKGLAGLSRSKLSRAPHGIDLGPLVPCLRSRLPNGRITMAPSLVVADVPRLRAALEAPHAATDALLLIGRRHVRSNNSWMHNAPSLMRGKNRCTLMMNPADADARHIGEGESVRVRSRVGEVDATVELTGDLMPGVVSLPHGFGHGRPGVELRVATKHAGVSVNDLTDDADVDAVGGTAVLNGVEVRVLRSSLRKSP